MHDTLIVGAGMAGLTAAIYAARKRMDYHVVAGEFGGQFAISGDVENYPGIVATTGEDLLATMREQVEENGIEVQEAIVEKIEKSDGHFVARLEDEEDIEAKTVIVATGSRPRKLGAEGEDDYANKGVTYCSVCDGPLFDGKTVAIVGGGDAALEAVDFMADIAEHIHLIVKGDDYDAKEGLVENAKAKDNVETIFNAQTTKIRGDEKVTGLIYEQDGEEHELELEGVIIEIGRTPNTGLVKGLVDLDDHDHINIGCQATTSVKGVYAAGDCASGHEYQYAIAAGQGCIALIKAARYLADKANGGGKNEG